MFCREDGPLRQLLGCGKLHCPCGEEESGSGGEGRILRGEAGAESARAGTFHLLGGADPRKESGADRKGGEAGLRYCRRLREKPGKAPQRQTAGETLQLLCKNAGLVCQGYGGGASCADSNESAEILFYTGGRPGSRGKRWGIIVAAAVVAVAVVLGILLYRIRDSKMGAGRTPEDLLFAYMECIPQKE